MLRGKIVKWIDKNIANFLPRSQGVEVRFSSEDAFRSDLTELLTLAKAVE